MLYELRVYEAMPGKLPDVLNRFQNVTQPIFAKHGIRAVGFWTTAIGVSTQHFTYMLAWESLAEREAKWNKAISDPIFREGVAEADRNGPCVASTSSQILRPTAFSPLP